MNVVVQLEIEHCAAMGRDRHSILYDTYNLKKMIVACWVCMFAAQMRYGISEKTHIGERLLNMSPLDCGRGCMARS